MHTEIEEIKVSDENEEVMFQFFEVKVDDSWLSITDPRIQKYFFLII